MPNNIDPTRLTAIFKTIAASESSKTQRQNEQENAKEAKNTPAIKIKKDNRRDKEVLKRRIRDKLGELNPEDEQFEQKASLAAIKEVIFWEFGDELVNHPEFNQLTQTIFTQVSDSEELMSAFRKMSDALLR